MFSLFVYNFMWCGECPVKLTLVDVDHPGVVVYCIVLVPSGNLFLFNVRATHFHYTSQCMFK